MFSVRIFCSDWGCIGLVMFRPVKVFEGVGELQARQEEHRLQKLLQPLQSLHAARCCSAGLDHLINVLSKTLTHLHTKKTLSSHCTDQLDQPEAKPGLEVKQYSQ